MATVVIKHLAIKPLNISDDLSGKYSFDSKIPRPKIGQKGPPPCLRKILDMVTSRKEEGFIGNNIGLHVLLDCL